MLHHTVSADATLHLSTSDNHSTAKPPTQKAQSNKGGTITTDRPTIVSFRDKVEIAKSKSLEQVSLKAHSECLRVFNFVYRTKEQRSDQPS